MGPSRFIHPMLLHYCRPMRQADISSVIDNFTRAAELAADAGFDAVELHFGHLYLPSSFLSPLINRRKDEYGGSVENRSRFVREIAGRVRDAVGDRIAVIAKLSMTDGMPGGITLQDSIRTAQLLDADGNLDAIELTEGSSVCKSMAMFRGDVPVNDWAKAFGQPMGTGVRLFGRRMLGEFPYQDLFMLDSARQFVPVVKNTKLVLLGGITNRENMVDGLKQGFDFLAMGRALLREPDLLNRLKNDPTTTSRCNHNNKCMVTVMVGRTHCVLDPMQRHGDVPDRLDVAESQGLATPG